MQNQLNKKQPVPVEYSAKVPLKDLLGAVTMGVEEEDLFLSLANRLIRLEKQITDKEKEKLLEFSGGKNLKQITKELINAFDPDEIEKIAQEKVASTPPGDYDKTINENFQNWIFKQNAGRTHHV